MRFSAEYSERRKRVNMACPLGLKTNERIEGMTTSHAVVVVLAAAAAVVVVVVVVVMVVMVVMVVVLTVSR